MGDSQQVLSLSVGLMVVGALVFLTLQFVSAPYGRHARSGWGPTLPNRLSWLLMEAPASLVFFAVYAAGAQRAALTPLVLLTLWQVHYVHRAFIYPWSLRSGGKRNPWLTVLMGMLFNSLNAYINARWISELGDYPATWLTSPSFLIGTLVFVVGFGINKHADHVLRCLRENTNEGEYSIPHGGCYRFVSCPNYLGELLQWTGWAIATSSVPGLAFMVFTASNLVPRARSHHAWYRERFEDYPPKRRALIPFVW